MGGALRARRAEGESGEAAATARPDDQQGGMAGRVEETGSCPTLAHDRLDGHVDGGSELGGQSLHLLMTARPELL